MLVVASCIWRATLWLLPLWVTLCVIIIAPFPVILRELVLLAVLTTKSLSSKTSNSLRWLYPVYYLPGLLMRLISIGQLLNSGLELRSSSSLLSFTAAACNMIWPSMQCKPHSPGQNLYWLSARLTSKHSLLALSFVHTIDYDIMHRCFAHPSKDVLWLLQLMINKEVGPLVLAFGTGQV